MRFLQLHLFSCFTFPPFNFKFPLLHLSPPPGHTANGLPVHLPIQIEEIPGLPVHLLHRASIEHPTILLKQFMLIRQRTSGPTVIFSSYWHGQQTLPSRHKSMLSVHKSDSCPWKNIAYIYMHIYNGNIPPNICTSCQSYLGHWEFDNCPKEFRSHPIKLNNGMLVHHTKYCYRHTSIWFFRRGKRQYHSFTGYSGHLLHEQLKLAGAARGLPGDHGPPKSSFFASTD